MDPAILRLPPDHPDAARLIEALNADLHGRYPEAHVIHGLESADVVNPRLIFLVAYDEGQAAACGAVREVSREVGEIKRMFVSPVHRGRGLARALLTALEVHAAHEGYSMLRIETGARQAEAIALYRSAGYRGIAPFGAYEGNPYSVCFEKTIDGAG